MTGQNSDTLFLPESLTTGSPSAYRVLVMQQIGMRECDTLQSRMDTALARLPQLASDSHASPEAGPRVGDYRLLFDCFFCPGYSRRSSYFSKTCVFKVIYYATIRAWQNTLPDHHAHLLNEDTPTDLISRGKRWRLGERLSNDDGLVEQKLYTALQQHAEAALSVYDSVAVCANSMRKCCPAMPRNKARLPTTTNPWWIG